MRIHRTAALLTASLLMAGGFFGGHPASAQTAPASPAVQQVPIQPIGKVISLAGAVTITHVNAVVVQVALGNQRGVAKVGDAIYLGDVAETGADGRLGITFNDGTAFNLSSNAHMAMTEFVYNPNSKSNSTLLSLTKGTFTFVAGAIAKTGDMRIDTPVATMGIRGTTPHVEISDNGRTVKFSTLIEDGKKKVLKDNGITEIKPRRAATTPPGPDVVRELRKPNIDICRGC